MKVKLTLSVESVLVDLAKKKNMNLSDFVERALANHFRLRKEIRWLPAEAFPETTVQGVQEVISA